METSKNIAAQIVDAACQEFQELVNQQAFLEPRARKSALKAKICKWLSVVSAMAFVAFIVIHFVLNMDDAVTMKKSWTTIGFFPLAVMAITALLFAYFNDRRHRSHQQNINIVKSGRINYIKEVINRALMEHMCANDESYTEDFYFKRMKKITSGFFADDFNSSLTAEETSEMKNWLRSSYSACLRAD